MQITLNQDEIVAAVVAYVHGQINVAANQKIEVDFKAGRGDNGITATLDIRPNTDIHVLGQPVVSAVALPPAASTVSAAPFPTAVVTEEVPVAPAEPAKAKTTKATGIFGKAIKAEVPAPLEPTEPSNILEELTLPQQDPENFATMSSELDDVPTAGEEEESAEAPAPASPIPAGSIFKFSKG